MKNIKFTLIDKGLKVKNIQLEDINKFISSSEMSTSPELKTETISKDVFDLMSAPDLDRLAIERAEDEGMVIFDKTQI